jgi:hypothetical protein
MIKTKFDSYCSKDLCSGCKFCLRGEKLVLFITGKCVRDCFYCPLSKKRKGLDIIYANERICKSVKDVILEAKVSNAKGAGITGGDPLMELTKTIKFAKALKSEFGKNFHIHIYISTRLITEDKIKKLSEVVDEIRFHPEFFSKEEMQKSVEKISLAKKYFERKNIGVEIPIFPDKKKETLELVREVSTFIGFLNLNELEVGECNLGRMLKLCKTNIDGYTVKNSIKVGKEILEEIEKEKLGIKVHLCTAKTKNWHQYGNRLKNYEVLPFGKKTEEGMVIYLVSKDKKIISYLDKKDYFFDKIKDRIILSPRVVEELKNEFEILRVEEYPTNDRDEAEISRI